MSGHERALGDEDEILERLSTVGNASDKRVI